MSQVAHEVHTSDGKKVTVYGADVSAYRKLEDWVRDHNPAIANALAAAGVVITATSFYITHVRKK